MTIHTINKGFDLRLAGRPDAVFADAPEPARVCLETAAFPGIKPKVLVKEGDRVVTGQPVFLDKTDRELVWCSPVTGAVLRIDFGERRFLQRIVIENGAAKGGREQFAELSRPGGDRAAVVKAIKAAGLWPLLRQRPLGKMPHSDKVPVAIFVNGMDTAPLAADPAFAVQGRKDDLQAGVAVLEKLTTGKVYLTLRAAGDHQADLRDLKGVEVHDFAGPHPAGLVGTHISRIRPLKVTEIAYVLSLQDLARLGEWARTGRYPAKTVVALAGSAAPGRKYYRVRQSAELAVLSGGKAIAGDVRVIDGTVLSGNATAPDGHLGFHSTTVTVIPEGTDQRDLFGWALPQFGKLSFHRSVFSWLLPKKEYVLDARLNGGHRPIVNIGAWESVTPLDIHPSYLLRAIQANDIEEAVKLGLLEVTEEDVALCTFVDPCKIDVGKVIRQGLDLYEKEG
ncbi:MAG TPA: Na(+)-translocating NADH-quinone reductase subunit A [Planctomycetota bacterium]|nr:Na(+)-translocating NADH-quinone reductase subunit A [Planctomycetota bacterium]